MLLDLPVEVLQCIYVLAAVRDPESAAALQATCFRMYALTSTAPVLRDIARELHRDGSFGFMREPMIPYEEMNALFTR